MSENVKIENKKTGGKDLTAEIKNLVVEFRTDYGDDDGPVPVTADPGPAGSDRGRKHQAGRPGHPFHE